MDDSGVKQVSKHIYWSTEGTVSVDLSDPVQKRWWIKEVLMNGTMEDIRQLNWNDIRDALPHIYLPRPVRALWTDYFASRNS